MQQSGLREWEQSGHELSACVEAVAGPGEVV